MKKIILPILFLCSITYGQNVSIPNTLIKEALVNSNCVDLNADGIGDADADTDNDGEIQVAEAQAVVGLYCGIILGGTDLTGLEEFTNLQHLQISFINFTGVLDFTILPQLKSIDCNGTLCSGLNFNGLTQLESLNCSGCLLANLDVSTLVSLKNLNCQNNNLTSLDLSVLTNLENLDCSGNQLTSLNVQGCTGLTKINCYQNQLTDVDFSNLVNLQTAQIMVSSSFDQQLTSINLSGCAALTNDQIYFSPNLSTLNFQNCATLQTIRMSFNTVNSINLAGCSALLNLNIGRSTFTNIDFTDSPNLYALSLQFNNLSTLDLSGYTNLFALDVSHGNLTSLNLNGCTNLNELNVNTNPQLATLDVSTCTNLDTLILLDNDLTSLFIKNGRNENILFSGNSNLQYICADESQFTSIEQQILSALPNAVMNSYCSFVPGGNYNTITGALPFDLAGDGCDAGDSSNPYIKVKIDDGTNAETAFTNNAGNYAFYTQSGNFTVTPLLENPSYFNFSPVNASINFPLVDNSVQTQDFCLTANGFHLDLEVVLVPIDAPRPGFDTRYQIIFRNKGNQIQNASVLLDFDDTRMDLVSSNPAITLQNVNQLEWDFVNLKPFETRKIDFVMNINTPLETPAVNIGDILNFDVLIVEDDVDENPADNTFSCHQTVVSSHDPNDKACLEGRTITPDQVGKYIHYNINFENLGTADATNIVVKDIIDIHKLDISSMQLLYASHPVESKIRDSISEFVFRNIHLPPTNGPIGGHGNVLFKIKTLPDLEIDDEILNTANIYFDYNAPISTNEARTVIASLKNPSFIQDKSIQIAPNPAKDKLNITAGGIIKSIQLFDAQGRILQTILEHKKNSTLDISDKANGVYFVKVMTENGGEVQKIVKEN
ncbi:T9SS type A sorting domain-containing protein [Flavobacterium sp. CYK-4]|uniref:DUF7619 domain-containing protein n=1 Tax=Flavobacterium lotistagni TaxID=2709660 RepID=UPI001409AA5E|nr:T9SS type A sorting domain-containing protein [Flavobacterium lotistagni]NHM06258.1 T9SS type A sorting domain-containing protein [Flavobacterium lotistagni]